MTASETCLCQYQTLLTSAHTVPMPPAQMWLWAPRAEEDQTKLDVHKSQLCFGVCFQNLLTLERKE